MHNNLCEELSKKRRNGITVIHEYTEKTGRVPVMAPLAYGVLFEMKKAVKDASSEKENTSGKSVSIADKYSLSIQEAAEYYGIGEKRLRSLIAEHSNELFILEIGSHIRIKRRLFEEFLDQAIAV